MNKAANKVFDWYETKVFERERTDIGRYEELLFSLDDFLSDEENFDTILEVSGLLDDYVNEEDAELACKKMIVMMLDQIDKVFVDPILAIKGAQQC